MIPFPLRLVLFLLHEGIGIYLIVQFVSLAFPILKYIFQRGSWPRVHVSVKGARLSVKLPPEDDAPDASTNQTT